jgi:hypothetical protein
MVPDEKTVLVHWYYSVSEWEQFLKREKKKRVASLLIESMVVFILSALTLHFGITISWTPSVVIGLIVGILYTTIKFYMHLRSCKWTDVRMPEITIMNGIVMINGKQIIFNGQGKCMRKINITEEHNINIIEITYEWKKGERLSFDEIKVPVPKGKLKEAVGLVNSLS